MDGSVGGRGDELHLHERDASTTRSPASFAIDTRTIAASARARTAAISPSGAVSVNYGANQSFTITPDAEPPRARTCWWTACSVGAVTSYTFTNVTAEPHDRRELRDRHVHDHGVARARTAAISPSGVGQRELRRQPELHDHAERELPRRATCWWTAASVGAVTSYTFTNVTVEPHDRGELRDRHAARSPRAAGLNGSHSARAAR